MNRRLMWLLLGVVAAAAAVLSFSALRDLAKLCGFSPALSWMLPLVVDAGAAASCSVWLRLDTPAGTRTYARALTWLLLTASVAGNAVVHALTAYHRLPAWGLVVVVSAVAPAVLGAVVHLATQLGRARPGDVPVRVDDQSPAEAPATVEPTIPEPVVPSDPVLEAIVPEPPAVPVAPARRTQPDEIRQHRGRRSEMVRWATERNELPSLKTLQAHFRISQSTAKRVRADARGAA